MSDDVKAVAQEILDRTEGQIGTHSTECHKYHLACFAAFVLRALEAVQQTAAVDRDALARFFFLSNGADEKNWAYLLERIRAGREQYYGQLHCYQEADALLASGILQDIAVVKAEALEEFTRELLESLYGSGVFEVHGGQEFVSTAVLESELNSILNRRAQQLREENA